MLLEPTKSYRIIVEEQVSEITPKDGRAFALAEVQGYVDGLIEIVRLNNGQIMIVNEEGKFTKKANLIATAIARLSNSIMSYDYICGDVVICPSPMFP